MSKIPFDGLMELLWILSIGTLENQTSWIENIAPNWYQQSLLPIIMEIAENGTIVFVITDITTKKLTFVNMSNIRK